MRFKFLIIPSVLIFQTATAQDGSSSVTISQATVTTPAVTVSSTAVAPPSSKLAPVLPDTTRVAIMDYKSVFEAATIEEEVKMATERFGLSTSQQDMWLTAAGDRRAVEKQAREKFELKAGTYDRDAVYRGLRAAHNTFNENVTGYLSPVQKSALETDRAILEEKRKRLAKLPPPPPPAPTVTVAPVDSAAIKETEKAKAKGKKAKKKKKTVG